MFISIFKSELYHKLKIDPSTSTHEATFTFNYGHSFHLYVIGFVFVELSGILNVGLFSRLQSGHSMISSRYQPQQVSWWIRFWDFPDSHFHSAWMRKAESYRNPISPNFLNYVTYWAFILCFYNREIDMFCSMHACMAMLRNEMEDAEHKQLCQSWQCWRWSFENNRNMSASAAPKSSIFW